MALLTCYDPLLFIFFRLNPLAPASICKCFCFQLFHAHNKRPSTLSANSQLANLRHTNQLLNLGQIWTDGLVQPWHCQCAADWLLSERMRFSSFFLFFPLPAPPAFLRRAEKHRKASPLASFQHLSFVFNIFQFSTVCWCLLFPAFFCEKGRFRFERKRMKKVKARGWRTMEDTPPGLDQAAKFADMACELSWDPIGRVTGCLLSGERL